MDRDLNYNPDGIPDNDDLEDTLDYTETDTMEDNDSFHITDDSFGGAQNKTAHAEAEGKDEFTQEKASFEKYFTYIDRSIKKNSRYSIGDEFRNNERKGKGTGSEAADGEPYNTMLENNDFTGDNNDFEDTDDFNDEYYSSEDEYRLKRDVRNLLDRPDLESFDDDEYGLDTPVDELPETYDGAAESLSDFYGVKAWTYDPAYASAANLCPSSSIYIAKIFIEQPIRITSMLASVSFPVGYTDAYAGIYDAGGKLIAKTENMGCRLADKGVQAMDFPESVTLRHQRTVYLALLMHGISTPHLNATPPSAAMQIETILPLRAGAINGQYCTLPESIPLEDATYSTPYFWLALR